MTRWISSSLQRKLTLITLISTLVPLLLLGGFTYMVSIDITQQKQRQSSIDTLGQMESKLRFVIGDIETLSIFLTGQADIQQYVSTTAINEQVKTRILSFMSDLASSKPYISNIMIVPRQFNPPLSTSNIYETELDDMLDIKELEAKAWSELYTMKNYSGDHQVISFIRPMRSVHTFRHVGWLVMSLNEEVVAEIWSEPGFADGLGQIALVNERGNVLSSSERGWLRQPLEELFPGISTGINRYRYGESVFGSGGERKNVIVYEEPSTGWKLIGMAPYNLNRSQNMYILQLTAAALIIAMVTNAGLVLFVVQRVTNPLRILTRLLTKVNPEEPMLVYHSSSTDEIGQLGASYNKLGQHIRELKELLIRNETRKKEADIRALQAQINPHFLYNTLSSIHWMALMNDDKKTAEMVGALSDFLQFSLNKGSDFCPVRQEFAHIRNYTQIQSIRFPDKFSLDVVVDPQFQDKFMLKLLLQPLLENSMIHGIQKKAGKGTIAVYLERKLEGMQFSVLDDGVGMTDERLNELAEMLQQEGDNASYAPGASYGLRNVNERLRLHYGPSACLHIESKANKGTKVSFTIPALDYPPQKKAT